jgi:hypothetical protein
MTSVSGTRIAQPGDSGGPVIAYEAGKLKICGTMIGAPDDGKLVVYHPFYNLIPIGWEPAIVFS